MSIINTKELETLIRKIIREELTKSALGDGSVNEINKSNPTEDSLENGALGSLGGNNSYNSGSSNLSSPSGISDTGSAPDTADLANSTSASAPDIQGNSPEFTAPATPNSNSANPPDSPISTGFTDTQDDSADSSVNSTDNSGDSPNLTPAQKALKNFASKTAQVASATNRVKDSGSQTPNSQISASQTNSPLGQGSGKATITGAPALTNSSDKSTGAQNLTSPTPPASKTIGKSNGSQDRQQASQTNLQADTQGVQDLDIG